jgi:hypothetical protein
MQTIATVADTCGVSRSHKRSPSWKAIDRTSTSND